jgi:hypothetical protein
MNSIWTAPYFWYFLPLVSQILNYYKFIIFVKLGDIGCSSFAANKRDAMANFKICSLG